MGYMVKLYSSVLRDYFLVLCHLYRKRHTTQ